MKIETMIEATPEGFAFRTLANDVELDYFAIPDWHLAVGRVYSTVCCHIVASEEDNTLEHHVFGPPEVQRAFENEIENLQTLVCLTYGMSGDKIFCVSARDPELSLELFTAPAEAVNHYMLATVGQETFRVLLDLDNSIMQTLQKEFDAIDKKLLHTQAH